MKTVFANKKFCSNVSNMIRVLKGMELIWIPVLPRCYYCTAGDLGVNVKPSCCK